MKSARKSKPARKRRAARKTHRRPGAAARSAKLASRRHRRPVRPKSQSPYAEAISGLQDAATSMADADLLEILGDLSWPARARWLSSYFADQLPEEIVADGDGLSESIEDLGAQVAALLAAMGAEQPADFLHAVTCCFSADPAQAAAGASWLAENTGTREIDLDALADLPGYRAVAEILERLG